MRKRVLAAFLALFLVFGLLPGTARAAEIGSGTCGADGDNVTWSLDDGGTLTISGTGKMEDFSSLSGRPWHENTDAITTVVIEDGVTSIGSRVFEQFDNLTSVTIPDSVTSIGYYAFYGCWRLPHVNIPDSVISIEYAAFSACHSLTRVNIPASVTFIGFAGTSFFEGSFSGRNLSEITVDAGNSMYTSVDGVLFNKEMSKLVQYPAGKTDTSYIIPDSVTSIENVAFSGCDLLTNVVIPNGVTSIGSNAFAACDGLTRVSIPASVTSIGFNGRAVNDGGFPGCQNLSEIIVDAGNSMYTSVDGVLFNKEMSKLVQYPAGKAGTSYIIPDSVTSVEHGAFSGCNLLTNVVIPNGVTSIGGSAFSGCDKLSDVYYSGTEDSWKRIQIVDISNTPLLNATIHYGATGPDNPDTPDKPDTPVAPERVPLPDGVKFVPYSYQIAVENGKSGTRSSSVTVRPQTFVSVGSGTHTIVSEHTASSDSRKSIVKIASLGYTIDTNTARYNISEGTLPQGLTLDGETGEISGVPMTTGQWDFTVTATANVSGEEEGTFTANLPFSLTIVENTDSAVQKPNDYEITTPVGRPCPTDKNHFIVESYRDYEMEIQGPFQEFRRLLIDGQEKILDVDYSVREGSTIITIFGQTLASHGGGTHTVAAQFQNAQGKTLTVSQNYTVQIPQPVRPAAAPAAKPSTPDPAPDKNTDEPTTDEPVTDEPAADEPDGLPFGDVSPSDWFYGDVVWAYDEEIMTGVTKTSFAPQESISQATIVTVLARMSKVDLTKFSGTADNVIAAGQWYSEAAIWAKQSGLLPDYNVFTGNETISREQMAIMLAKYLQSMGKDTSAPEQPVQFADAGDMSQAGNDAFQTLYAYRIFRGVGDGRMNPLGSTTRAQFAALAHRISDAVK